MISATSSTCMIHRPCLYHNIEIYTFASYPLEQVVVNLFEHQNTKMYFTLLVDP